MGLVWRGDRPYYYQTRREGDRFTCRYVAGGATALAFAAIADHLRDEEQEHRRECREADQRARDLARQRRRVERERWLARSQGQRDQEAEVVAALDRVQGVIDAAMVAAGWHKHKRQWRRRLMSDPQLAAEFLRAL